MSILRWINYIFDQEMFGTASIYDALTSCTRSYQKEWKLRKTLPGMQCKGVIFTKRKLCVQLVITPADVVLEKSMWAASWQNESAPSEVSDQPEYPPSLIRVFVVRMKTPWLLSHPLSAQRRFWSAQADLSLRWAHSHFVGFVISRLM